MLKWQHEAESIPRFESLFAVFVLFFCTMIGVLMGLKPTVGVLGIGSIAAVIFLAKILPWLIKRREWLYGLLLCTTALAPIFQIDKQATSMRNLTIGIGYMSAMLLVVVFLLKVVRNPAKLEIVPAIDVFLISLMGWQFLSLLRAENIRNTLVAALANVLIIISCVYGLRVFLRERPELGKVILFVWHLIGLFVAVIGLLLIFIGPIQIGAFEYGNYELRSGLPYVASILNDTNAVGNLTYLALIATYTLWIGTQRRRVKLYLLFTGILIGSALLLSFSRSGYLGFALGALVLLWKRTPLWLKWLVLIVLLIVGGGVYKVINSDPDWVYAFKLDAGLSGRDEVWGLYIGLLRESPIVGKGSLVLYFNKRWGGGEETITPHNAYLHTAVFCGYVGLLFFVGAQIATLVTAVKGQRGRPTAFSPWVAHGGFAMAVALSVQQLFVARLFPGMDYMHIAFWIALTMATMPFLFQRSEQVDIGEV